MKKSRLLGAVYACILTIFNTPISAATVALDTTTISFVVGGFPGTQSGTWSAPLLNVPSGTSVDYFYVEFANIVGSTPYITFNSTPDGGNNRKVSFCGSPTSCPTTSSNGSSATIISGTYNQAYDVFERLVDTHHTIINSGSIFTGSESLSGELIVTAFGDVATIPIPPALWLFGSGLLVLIGSART